MAKKKSKFTEDNPNVGQARLDHISARGKNAHDTPAEQRTAQQKKDSKIFRDTFGDEEADKDEAFAKRKRDKKKQRQ